MLVISSKHLIFSSVLHFAISIVALPVKPCNMPAFFV